MNLHARPKKLTFTYTLFAANTSLLLLLAAFQLVPLPYGSTAQYINQASLQRTRAILFSRSALIMEFRPKEEYPQALSDMQTALPLFVQEQTLLMADRQTDIQSELQLARPDYLAIVASVQAILNQKERPIDPAEVDIILSHSMSYTLTMNFMLQNLQIQANNWNLHLTLINELIIFCLLCCSTSLFLLNRQYRQSHLANIANSTWHS